MFVVVVVCCVSSFVECVFFSSRFHVEWRLLCVAVWL